MAAKHYGAAELIDLLAHLAKPFTDAWKDEGGPGWWARTKARAAGWLRRLADRLSPPAPAVTLAVTIQLPTPAPAPEPAPTPEPAREPALAAPVHTCGNSAPATPAKRTRKPAAKPRAKAKPVPAAARTTRPKPKAKPAPKQAKPQPAAARKPARRKPAAT